MNSVHFGINLRRIFPNVEKIRPSRDGKRINEYQGLISIDDAAIVKAENEHVATAEELNWPDEKDTATVKQKVTMADTEGNIPF